METGRSWLLILQMLKPTQFFYQKEGLLLENITYKLTDTWIRKSERQSKSQANIKVSILLLKEGFMECWNTIFTKILN